jgi:hypothetical protein
MTEADIELVERELKIVLPLAYKRAVVPFQIRALAGNTDQQLWDDAAALIQLNQKLRAGSRMRPAWPLHMFAVGDPHGDELYAMDLRSPEATVWWLDHGMIDSKASYNTKQSFAKWAEEFYRDTRQDLEGDGVSADDGPKSPTQLGVWGLIRYLFCLFAVAVILLGGLLLISWFIRWLKHLSA